MSAVLVGDENGLFKLVEPTKNLVSTFGISNREQAIKGIIPCQKNQYFILKNDGTLELMDWNRKQKEFTLVNTYSDIVSNPIGLKTLFNNQLENVGCVSYNEAGNVGLYYKSEEDDEPMINQFQIKGPLSACATAGDSIALFGGKENDVQLYDLSTQQSIWQARNVPFDNLHLRVPVWITSLDFVKPLAQQTRDASQFVTGTGYRHVRLYDTKANNRPTITFELESEFRVTTVRSLYDGHSLFVSDTAGNLFKYDLRTQKRIATLKGSAGSIRDSILSDDGKELVCVGLDRYAKWYSAETGKLKHSVYLKNRLNCASWFVGGLETSKQTKKVDDEDDGDNDKLQDYRDSDEEVDEEVDDEEEEEDDEDEMAEGIDGEDDNVEGESEEDDEDVDEEERDFDDEDIDNEEELEDDEEDDEESEEESEEELPPPKSKSSKQSKPTNKQVPQPTNKKQKLR